MDTLRVRPANLFLVARVPGRRRTGVGSSSSSSVSHGTSTSDLPSPRRKTPCQTFASRTLLVQDPPKR